MNETKQSDFQLLGGVEYAVAKYAFLYDAEENLDLVDPGRMQGCVNKAESIAVSSIESLPASVFSVEMDIEVVPDDVDFLSRIVPRYRLHEFKDVVRLAALPNFSVNLSGVGI